MAVTGGNPIYAEGAGDSGSTLRSDRTYIRSIFVTADTSGTCILSDANGNQIFQTEITSGGYTSLHGVGWVDGIVATTLDALTYCYIYIR